MLEIYFDGVLLDPDKYMSLSQNGNLFDKTFKLGATLCRKFVLEIPKADFIPTTQDVVIKYMSNDYAHLIIDKYEYNEGGGIPTVKITLCDRMVLANTNYNASSIVPTTTLGILQDICSKIGVELGDTTFENNDIVVDFFDSTVQARKYISYIAEIAGGFARIESDGKLYIRTFNNLNSHTLLPDLCEEILIGQKHKVERVVFDNGLQVYKTSEDETLETLYLDSENVYINDEATFNKIVAKIINFEYYNISTGSTYIMYDTIPGDILKLTYENIDYYTIEDYDTLNFLGSWTGNYKLNLDSALQQETKTAGLNIQIKAIKINMNRIDNELTIAVEDINGQQAINNELQNNINANTSLINQKANEINLSVDEKVGQVNDNVNGLQDTVNGNYDNLFSLIQENSSNINILKESITSTVKSTGGNNLLRNSVGFAGLDFWEVTNENNITTIQDSETEQTTVSGSKFRFLNNATLKQSYVTKIGNTYGVSFKLKHIPVGETNAVYVRLHRTATDYIDVLSTEESIAEYTDFHEFNVYTYEASMINPWIEIISNGNDLVEISDLIISNGENQSWSGYFDEVYGKQHRLDQYGLKLTDLASGNYSQTTNNAYRINSNGNDVAEISKNKVQSDNAVISNAIELGEVLTIIKLDDNNILEY